MISASRMGICEDAQSGCCPRIARTPGRRPHRYSPPTRAWMAPSLTSHTPYTGERQTDRVVLEIQAGSDGHLQRLAGGQSTQPGPRVREEPPLRPHHLPVVGVRLPVPVPTQALVAVESPPIPLTLGEWGAGTQDDRHVLAVPGSTRVAGRSPRRREARRAGVAGRGPVRSALARPRRRTVGGGVGEVLHPESAPRTGLIRSSTIHIIPVQGHFSIVRRPSAPARHECARRGRRRLPSGGGRPSWSSRDDVVVCETRLSGEDPASCGGLMVREPNELPLLERLTNHSGRLRPSELKVARAVLADPAAAVRVNMAALAATAGVSEPTVMRFCNGLGFDGFQSFRFALAEALAIGIPVTHSAISVDDSVAEMAMKIFDHTLSSLDRARRSLDTEAVTTAVDVLLEASRVVLVGLGASGIIAQDALQQAVLLGVPCAAPIDLHQQFMAASMMEPGSV